MPREPGKIMRRAAYSGGQITPSNPDPWLAPRIEGQRFTAKQVRMMGDMGLDPETVAVVEVRRVATARELWWPDTQHAPVFVLECPIIGPQRRDGRIEVLSPNGWRKLVYLDGAITRSKAPRRGRTPAQRAGIAAIRHSQDLRTS